MQTTLDAEFQKLIKKGDEVGKQLTEENIEDINSTIEEELSEDAKKLREIEATEHHESNYEDKARHIINPETGYHMPVPEDATDNFEDIDIDKLVDEWDESNYEINDDREVTLESVKKAVDNNITLQEAGLSESDILALQSLINRYKAGENISYYKLMPDSIKTLIDGSIGSAEVPAGTGRNMIAKSLLETLKQDTAVEMSLIDVNESVMKLNDLLSYSSFIAKLKDTFEVRYLEIAKKLEDTGEEVAIEKATKFRELSHAFTEAYTLNDLLATYKRGKLKVKKIQLEKFRRTCDEFCLKYRDTKLVIDNVFYTVDALKRHVDPKFDENIIKEFVCVFINYTRLMSADDITSHIFMYFFIKNILGLDYFSTEGSKDSDAFKLELIDTINNFLQVIVDNKLKKESAK